MQARIKFIKAKATLKALSAIRKSVRPPEPIFKDEELNLVRTQINSWKKKAVNSKQDKKIEELLAEAIEKNKVKEKFSMKYFSQIAQDPNRLSKNKFKHFLTIRYGPLLAEKLHSIIEF